MKAFILLMGFFILTALILAIPTFADTYQYYYGKTNTIDVTIEEKYSSQNSFGSGVSAYIITTDGEIYNVNDLQFAKLKINKTYTVEVVPILISGARTGTIKEIL